MDLELTAQDKKSLSVLRNLIKESGDELLLNAKESLTDDYLLRFIRGRKYDIKSAFERVQKTQDLRINQYPEVFAKLYPTAIQTAIDTRGACVLKGRDVEGRRVICLKAESWNPSVISVDDVWRGIIIVGWECLNYKDTQSQGISLVVDVKGFGFKHAKQMTPAVMTKYFNIILRSSPMKVKAIHIVNSHAIFNMSSNVLRMFLPHKIRKRFHAHASAKSESFHNFISPEVLPEWLGGNLKSSEALDQEMEDFLLTKERDDYYKSFVTEFATIKI